MMAGGFLLFNLVFWGFGVWIGWLGFLALADVPYIAVIGGTRRDLFSEFQYSRSRLSSERERDCGDVGYSPPGGAIIVIIGGRYCVLSVAAPLLPTPRTLAVSTLLSVNDPPPLLHSRFRGLPFIDSGDAMLDLADAERSRGGTTTPAALWKGVIFRLVAAVELPCFCGPVAIIEFQESRGVVAWNASIAHPVQGSLLSTRLLASGGCSMECGIQGQPRQPIHAVCPSARPPPSI